MASYGNADLQEIDKFDKIARIWWDPKGEMGTLHTINPLRVSFIMEGLPKPNPALLDVGCGGGILAEALAHAGAHVTGIDLSESSIQVARQHAQQQRVVIDYRCEDVEAFSHEHAGSFDVVTCMEMLEHVPYPEKVVEACSQALKPGGNAFFSTINRTPKAFLFDVVIGEYILHLLPRGSHKYQRLIRPQELKDWAGEFNLELRRISSLIYNPLTRKFKVAAGREDVNYMVHFLKRSPKHGGEWQV